MILFIDRVFIQHFREYTFEAENDLGRVAHIIELKRGKVKVIGQIGHTPTKLKPYEKVFYRCG